MPDVNRSVTYDYVPNTLAGFKAAFFDASKRPLTEQDIFDAGVRSGMARASAPAAQSDDARNLVTLDRRDLWDHMRGAIYAALNDKIPKDCVVSWAWEEATNRTMDIFQKIVDTAAPAAPAQSGEPLKANQIHVTHTIATDENAATILHGLLDSFVEVAAGFPKAKIDEALARQARIYLPKDAAPQPQPTSAVAIDEQQTIPLAWQSNFDGLLAYVLQDDLHNRLTPRVIDIAYTAFMSRATGKNKDDGGQCDWFNDTKPVIQSAITKLSKDLSEARAASQQATALYTMEQMRDYADAFHQSRTEATATQPEQATQSEPFPYQKTFDAIAAATSVTGCHVAISVTAFRDAFGPVVPPAPRRYDPCDPGNWRDGEPA